MRDWSLRTIFLVVIGGLFCVSLAFLCGLIWIHQTTEREAIEEAVNKAQHDTRRAAKAINDTLSSIVPLTKSIADSLSSGAIKHAYLFDVFEKAMQENPGLFGVGAAYAPLAHPSGDTLFAPYYAKLYDKNPAWKQVEDSYDYTEFKYSWYHDPMLDGAMWNEPYFGEVSQTVLAEYCEPFYRPGWSADPDEPAGIIYINYSLDFLRDLMEAEGPDKAAYDFIFSSAGHFINHPRDKMVQGGESVFEMAWTRGSETLHTMAVHAIKGGSGFVEYFDETTGQSSLIFFEPISSPGWVMGVVFFKDAFREESNAVRHRLILIVLSFLFCGLLVSAFLLVYFFFSSWMAPWGGAIALSLFLTAGIATTWYISDKYPDKPQLQRKKLVDRSTLEEFMDSYVEHSKAVGEVAPLFVPTGIFIQSIDFSSGLSVEASGYIWQKYAKGAHDGLQRGVVLPEAVDPEWLQLEKAYHRHEENYELIGWYFTASLRQEFTYTQYPFDHQEIWLRLWHKDFDMNVVLVPDLEAYKLTDPLALPGVDETLVLPDWTVKSSYFDSRTHSYNTDFGIEKYVGMDDFPELSFNIEVKRKFIGPFVSKVIPVAVVAAMLFSILAIGSKQEEGANWFGFTAMDVVVGCTALFFVTIFEHISLRETLALAHVSYFEYFYFTMYFAMLLVSINSISFASKIRIWVIDLHDNLIPKLLFWPVFLELLFVLTLKVFY